MEVSGVWKEGGESGFRLWILLSIFAQILLAAGQPQRDGGGDGGDAQHVGPQPGAGQPALGKPLWS